MVKEPHSSYTPFLFFLNLKILRWHRVRLDLHFPYELLARNIDCPNTLGRLSFFTSTRTTLFTNVINLSVQVTNYAIE